MGKRTGKPVGRPSWVQPGGERLELINKYRPMWEKCTKAAYNKMVDEFVERWGTFDLDSDPATVDDPSVFVLRDVNSIEDMDERNKEIMAQAQFKHDLRKRLGFWTRNQWTTKKKDPTGLSTLIAQIKKMTTTAPRKPSVLQYYQHKYYQTQLRDDFKAKCEADQNGSGEGSMKENIAGKNKFCAERWNTETDGFKQRVLNELEEDHQEALDQY
ncbi:hypothetical protein PM082_022123 [Marasmius tenuissimus]|nr:hypothetical protein PM082_022123 [Marasmius tenuissimus]